MLENSSKIAEPLRTFDERSSGVRRALAVELRDEDDDAPTLRPRLLGRSANDDLAPVHELLYRFDVGDHRGALAAAEALLDRTLVPRIIVPHDLLSARGPDTTTALLLSCIDGKATLEAVLERSDLPLIDALRVLCDLLDARLVALT